MRLGQHISGIVIFAALALALGASGAARAAETAENPGQVLPINLLPNASLSETASVTASLSESIGGDGTFLQYSLTNNGPIGGSGDGSRTE